MSDDDLTWLTGILVGGEFRRVEGPERAAGGAMQLDKENYVAVPTRNHVRLLAPAPSRPLGAAIARYGATGPRRLRMASAIGSAAAATGLLGRLLRPAVTLDPGGPSGREASTLARHCSIACGRDTCFVSLSAGPVRPNRKPVAQVMDDMGRLIAFAKIGSDSHTAAMVENEHRALSRLVTARPASFVAPRPMASTSWRGLMVGLVEPLNLKHSTPVSEPPLATLAELTTASRRVELGSCPALIDQRRRSAAFEEVDAALAIVTNRFGDTEVRSGLLHGDWAPWNMALRGSTLYIWDWERSRDGAPVGWDLAHWYVQTSLARGDVLAAACRSAVQGLRRDLPHLSTQPSAAEPILASYLVELALRYCETGLAHTETIASRRTEILSVLPTIRPLQNPRPGVSK